MAYGEVAECKSGHSFPVGVHWWSHFTTHRYVEADLAMKEKALAKPEAPDTKMGRDKVSDSLMRFLQTL